MTIAYICVMIAGLLPYLWIAVSKKASGFKLKNNTNPREFLGNSSGVAKRALWAQENSWEAFAPFAAAVIIASILGAEQSKVDMSAMFFIFMRLLHGISYLIDKPTIRSIVWTLGIVAVVNLYYLAWSL